MMRGRAGFHLMGILSVAPQLVLVPQRSLSAQTIAGEVVEALTKQPLRGYPVRLVYRGASDSTLTSDSATTDERGLFQMGGRGAGKYRLEFGPSRSRLETSTEVTALGQDTAITGRFAVPLLELGGAQAFSPRDVQEVAHPRAVFPLRYPKELLRDGVEGEVVVRFIVDPSGHVRPKSVQVISSTHPAFTRVVVDALRTLAFDPARVGGIAVPQTVQEPFNFSIQKAR